MPKNEKIVDLKPHTSSKEFKQVKSPKVDKHNRFCSTTYKVTTHSGLLGYILGYGYLRDCGVMYI